MGARASRPSPSRPGRARGRRSCTRPWWQASQTLDRRALEGPGDNAAEAGGRHLPRNERWETVVPRRVGPGWQALMAPYRMPEWTPLPRAGRGPMGGRGPARRGAGHLLRRGRVGRDANGPHEARAPVAVVHVVDMDAHAKVIRADHLAAANVDGRVGEPSVDRVGEDQYVPGLHGCGSDMGVAVVQHRGVLRRVIAELDVDPVHEARAAKARGGRVVYESVAESHAPQRLDGEAALHDGGRCGRG